MLDFARFHYLTFDCYGTLIDWESGILAALRPVLAAHGVESTDDAILHLYAEFEAREEKRAYRPYRLVLEQVVRAFGARMGFVPSPREVAVLAESVKRWLPFPDTVAALRRLATRYQLGIISNVDDDLFASTAQQLQIPFTATVTAQQACSYKPAVRNFQLALERLGASPDTVLHVAQSVYHDLEPAKHLGLGTIWVNRRQGKSGFGATLPGRARADLEVPDLKTLAGMALK